MVKFPHSARHAMGVLLSGAMLAGSILASCNPELMVLNKRGAAPYVMVGNKFGRIFDIIQTADNGFILDEGCSVALRVPGMTFMKSSFNINILEGEGVRLHFNTTGHDYNSKPGIIVDCTTRGVKITDEDGNEHDFPADKFGIDRPKFFSMEREGKYIKFSVECDEIWFKPCRLPASEFIVMESMGKSRAEVNGIIMDESFEK